MDELIDGRNTSQDLRLIQTAIRKKWKIPDAVFEHLPTRIAQIAADEDKNDRDRINAAKLLVAMNGQNSDGEKNVTTITVQHPGADLLD